MAADRPERVVHVRFVATHGGTGSFGRVAALLALAVAAPLVLMMGCGALAGLVGVFFHPSIAAFLGMVVWFGLWALPAYGAWRLYQHLSIKELLVGSDGVCISPSRVLYGEWFCAFDRVNRVEVDPRGVRLVLDAWSILLATTFVPLSESRSKKVWRLEQRDTLFALIREAHERATRKGETPANIDLLDRAGRSVDEWKAALYRLAKREGSYREARFEAEDLARVAEDATAKPARRAAAAIAVRAIGDPSLAERVRIASDACADSELRRALLEAIAEGEILEIELAGATERRA